MSGTGCSVLGRPSAPAVGALLALALLLPETSCAPFFSGVSTARLKISRYSPTSRCELSSNSIEAEPSTSPSTRMGRRDGRRRIVVRPSLPTRMSAVGGSAASIDSSTLPSPRPPSRLAPNRSSQYSLSNERYGIQRGEGEANGRDRDGDHSRVDEGGAALVAASAPSRRTSVRDVSPRSAP